ncbi:site-specific recombinase [Algoriphagus ratkowskyi]|nr:site-specific recombinase [Algoriphagus ratkowskyi]TXD77496.1 recombinase [Algoriphagus ratkowskyi]
MKLLDIIEEIKGIQDPSSPEGLILIVDEIRPPKKNLNKASENVRDLIQVLEKHQREKEALHLYFNDFINSKHLVPLLTNSGILTNKGFFAEASERMASKVLPRAYGDSDHTGTFNEIFHKPWDYLWINEIAYEDWISLFRVLGQKEVNDLEVTDEVFGQLTNSILVLSQRIGSLGLEQEILSKLPELEEFDSPFMVQNKDIFLYLDNIQNSVGFDLSDQNPDYKQILVMLNQCSDFGLVIGKNKRKYGADLHLTYLLSRLNQNIDRLRTLLRLIVTSPEKTPFNVEIELFKNLVIAENKKNSLSEHFENNIKLLAFQITEHASKTGEHYIANNRKEWWSMLFSSMGGGFIVGFLSIFKVLIYYLRLPLFGEAFMYSMNYSFGFMGIHLSHSTLATKQPSMTASNLSEALDKLVKAKSEALENLAEVIVRISRSQFIAFVGNVLIAFPVAFLIARGYAYFSGNQIAAPEKALLLIKELNPFTSFAILHAGIAGVFLFLSGLISGYYDNKGVYNKIPQRIKKHRFLNNVFGKKVTSNFSEYLDSNLGNLAGNFFLGIFLGCTGTIGVILGLPLDIRHITFASANFGLAFVSVGDSLSHQDIGVTIFGIICIGLMNFLVSFSLAIFVATKSRGVNFNQRAELFKIVLGRFALKPLQFFVPPKNIDSPIDELEVKK